MNPGLHKTLLDALVDSAKMIPFLLFIYFVVGWLEYQYGAAIRAKIQRAAKSGPFLGSVFGCIPQCGFSVLASAMYTRRFITIGTLLAVYLSTSDEAIPVIMSQPKSLHWMIPLICTKVLIAILAGYGVDIALRSYAKPIAPIDQEELEDLPEHGCCEHHVAGESRLGELVVHPLVHTAKVFLFVLLVTLGINYLGYVYKDQLKQLLLPHSPLQPVLTAFVGLIPNCAASVAITEVFIKGGISYGSAVSGLCASGGLGLLVLLKENHNPRDTVRVLALLVGISIAAGIVIQYVYG